MKKGWLHPYTAYTLILTAAAVLLTALLPFDPPGDGDGWVEVLFFAVFIAGAEALPVYLPQRNGTVSISFAVILAAAMLFSPGLVALLAAAATISPEEIRRRRWLVFLFNRAQLALAAGAAAWLYVRLGGDHSNFTLLDDGLPLLASGGVYFCINLTLVALGLAIREKHRVMDVWAGNLEWAGLNYVCLTPIAYLIADVDRWVGWVGLLFFLLPLLLARYSFKQYLDMQESYLQTVQSLVKALEAKDPYTAGHSDRVRNLCVLIAQRMRLPARMVEHLQYAAILHDVGKIGVPDAILNKPGRYEHHEYEQMKQHAEVGGQILSGVRFLGEAADWVMYHHERWDGSGYPRGLVGAEAPIGARIIAVADSFDAMTSARPYRQVPYSFERARVEIKNQAGRLFDPQVVDAFLAVTRDPSLLPEFTSWNAAGAGKASAGGQPASSADKA